MLFANMSQHFCLERLQAGGCGKPFCFEPPQELYACHTDYFREYKRMDYDYPFQYSNPMLASKAQWPNLSITTLKSVIFCFI
jgi:hypothetical protein